jgi:hypothetical protein
MIGLLVLFNIGGLIAMTQMAELADTPLYLAVSVFLAFTAIFYASVAETRPGLLRVIFNAYVVAAVATSLMGIAGYFNLCSRVTVAPPASFRTRTCSGRFWFFRPSGCFMG